MAAEGALGEDDERRAAARGLDQLVRVAGAFQVAAQAGIPAVPAAIRGARSVLRDGTWYLRRGAVAISFAAPVQPEGSDWNATLRLRDQVRAEILKRCGEPDAGQ